MGIYYFISYSNADGEEYARKLADHLLKVPPSIPVWLNERELQPGTDWDEQIVEALRECDGVLFLMTRDSVHSKSECKREWTRGLRYKKTIIPLLFDKEAEMPYRLEPRQYLDFTGNYDQALAALRDHIQWRSTPEGLLKALEERLSDAERDLPRADENERPRIEDEIEELKKEIAAQKDTIANPTAAAQKTVERIDSGLERERQPIEQVHPDTKTKFINPPPVRAPSWFQNRHVETELVGDFIKDPALRLMTVVGRGGVGKTAMVCRLLKALEGGHLPEDTTPLHVDGILYLSPKGLRQINLAHLYADLCKFLPPKKAEFLDAIYRNPHAPPAAKMQTLLEAFPEGRTIILLDNFEEVVNGETGKIVDAELDEALHALMELPEHGIKVIITTRIASRELQLSQPGRQTLLELDKGLKSPYAENILKAMDADGKLGLRDAPERLLAMARERTQGYPRALEALQAILAVDRSTSLEEVLAEAESLLPENVVEVLVGEAFSRLDTLAQQVMQALAILTVPVPEAAVDYLLQPCMPNINSAPILSRLVNMHFARREAGRFYLHQVDRSYALGRLPKGEPGDRTATNPPFTRYALLNRAADYFEQIRTPRESWKTIDDLVPQLAEFEARIAGEEYDAACTVLLEIDFNYLCLWGHSQLVASLHERLKDRLTDQQLIIGNVGNLGNCYFNLGNYKRAINYYEQWLAIAREIGDRWREGSSLGNLGNCYYSLADYPRAISYHEQSLAIAREVGDRGGEGGSLGSLGACYHSLGDYPRAIGYHEQSLAIAQEIGSRGGEGSALGSLGECYYSLGDYSRAISYHEQSLAIAREIGDRAGEGASLDSLGSCLYRMGYYQRAIDHHVQSLSIAREIGARYNESSALCNLGNCYISLDDYSNAIDYYEQFLVIVREIGARQSEGVALGNLGLCYYSMGDYSRAVNYDEQCLAIAHEVGDRYAEVAALVYLGDAYRDTDQSVPAFEYYLRATSIADETGNRQSQHEAYFGLALAHLFSGKFNQARENIDVAGMHDFPMNNAAMWTAAGIIRLRQEEHGVACEAFSRGLAEANGLLEKYAKNRLALDTKGLALCGLSLCEDNGHLTAAKETFLAARKITKAKGVVTAILKQFDALAQADAEGILLPLRKMAAGG